MKMHLQTDLSCEIPYNGCEEKVQISQEAEMLYYELIRALEEEETVRIMKITFWVTIVVCLTLRSYTSQIGQDNLTTLDSKIHGLAISPYLLLVF